MHTCFCHYCYYYTGIILTLRELCGWTPPKISDLFTGTCMGLQNKLVDSTVATTIFHK